jgi:glutamyl-tRNA reductase
MGLDPGALPVALVGCDFRVASSRWRSRLVLDDAEKARMAKDLRTGGWADGFVALETCNRNEWIVAGPKPEWAAELLLAAMRERLSDLGDVPQDQWGGTSEIRPYVYYGDEAAKHFFRVVLGLESLVVGERQIASQVFAAFDSARRAGRSSRVLNGLGTVAGRLAASALRNGVAGGSGTGVHALALAGLRSVLDKADQAASPSADGAFQGEGEEQKARSRRIAVVGMGATGRRVCSLIEGHPGFDLVRFNRTPEDGAHPPVLPLSELPRLLLTCDGAVFCTAARSAVFGPAILAAKGGSGTSFRTRVLVDVGIPEQVLRDGWPCGVRVLGLDDLVSLVRPVEGQVAARDASLLQGAMEEFGRFCAVPPYARILRRVRTASREMTGRVVPELVERHLGSVDARLRADFEAELKSSLARYASELIGTIREEISPVSTRPIGGEPSAVPTARKVDDGA